MADSTAQRMIPPEANAALDKILDSRGGILVSFAQVEWFLAKLIVEAAQYDEYRALDLSFSQDAEKRADRLKKILNVNGPLSPYEKDLTKYIDLVMKHVQLRTMAAHGLTVRPDDLSLSSIMHFRMYRMYKGGELIEETQNLSIKEYTDQTTELTAAAREFVRVVRRIWTDLKLPPLDPDPENLIGLMS